MNHYVYTTHYLILTLIRHESNGDFPKQKSTRMNTHTEKENRN